MYCNNLKPIYTSTPNKSLTQFLLKISNFFISHLPLTVTLWTGQSHKYNFSAYLHKSMNFSLTQIHLKFSYPLKSFYHQQRHFAQYNWMCKHPLKVYLHAIKEWLNCDISYGAFLSFQITFAINSKIMY